MGWTTGQSLPAMTTVLVAAGAKTDAAQTALHDLAQTPGVSVVLWNNLVQATSGINGTLTFQYDSTLSYSQTNQTLAQVVTALVAAGARSDQASQYLHTLAHKPNTPTLLWGVMVTCTGGWNTGAPVFSYTTNPS